MRRRVNLRACCYTAFMGVFFGLTIHAQESKKSDFWDHVHFGGGLGASFGNRYTDVSVAPAAIYSFNDYVAMGIGLQGGYVRVKDEYNSWLYGGSLITLFNPVEMVQISAELEQLRVNSEFEYPGLEGIKDNFWNTALFVGAGMRTSNVTFGIRYNLLHDNDRRIYNSAFMPFVRVFF